MFQFAVSATRARSEDKVKLAFRYDEEGLALIYADGQRGGIAIQQGNEGSVQFLVDQRFPIERFFGTFAGGNTISFTKIGGERVTLGEFISYLPASWNPGDAIT